MNKTYAKYHLELGDESTLNESIYQTFDFGALSFYSKINQSKCGPLGILEKLRVILSMISSFVM